MALEFACPHCGERTKVDDQYCGLSGPCFNCGKTIVVPLPESGALGPITPSRGGDARRRPWRIVLVVIGAGVLAAVASLTFIVGVAAPGVQSIRHASHRRECAANLKKIGQALERYHQQHGTYPPAYTVDADGKPLHSWRTLILPQLGYESLYRQFRLSEPHDSPHNQALQARMPPVYGCAADPDSRTALETSYMVVVGPRTLFPADGRGLKYDEVNWDPRGLTLLVVEVAESGVTWTAPEDLSAEQLRMVVNPSKNATTAIRSKHAEGAHVLLADGSVRFLSDLTPMELIAGIVTRDGRETLDPKQLDPE